MPIVTYVAPYSTFRGVVRSGGSLGGQVTYPVGRANYSRAWETPHPRARAAAHRGIKFPISKSHCRPSV